MFEIKACAVSEKTHPDGYRDEFFRNKPAYHQAGVTMRSDIMDRP
jgi:hypothetical protein